MIGKFPLGHWKTWNSRRIIRRTSWFILRLQVLDQQGNPCPLLPVTTGVTDALALGTDAD